MNVEIHLIQNFPPSCLNRDDSNMPKSTMFGGFRRARVSSQCLKRAMRLHLRDALQLPIGVRTRRLARELADRLEGHPEGEPGEAWQMAFAAAQVALDRSGFKVDAKDGRTSVGLYLGEEEIARLAEGLRQDCAAFARSAGVEAAEPAARGKKSKSEKKGDVAAPHWDAAVKSIRGEVRAVDIALFARMVAEVPEMELDAACQVAHALSTHAADTEMDYFTAVDDLQPGEDPGAGMLGLVGFNSPCLYRYALVEREQLIRNLGGDTELTGRAIRGLVQAAIEALPRARQNSTAPQVRPDYIRVTVGGSMPLNLVNAFERPIRAAGEDGSVVEESVRALEGYHTRLRRIYPDDGAQTFRCSTVDGYHDGSLPELLTWLDARLAEAR